SPMGMALVPVYNEPSGQDVGVVTITPQIVNNLGVKTAEVVTDYFSQTIDATGVLEYSQDRRMDISPRVSGWVEKLYVAEHGDTIKVGQPLYDIYSPELVNAQEEYILALSQDNNRLVAAAHKRLVYLAMSLHDIEQLKRTRQVKRIFTVHAHDGGIIESLMIKTGAFVTPSHVLMTVISLQEMWLKVDVFESQLPMVTLGAKAVIAIDGIGGGDLAGVVDKIYPMLNAQSRTATLRIRVANNDLALRANMFASASINFQSIKQSLMVPRDAVIRSGLNNRVVMALGDGKFKSVAVSLGRENQHWIEITDGLMAQDNVVTSAQFLIDSESNIASDLMRYQPADSASELASNGSVWTQAIVNRVMENHKMVNVTHEPIAQWDWPEMSMNFYVDESVDLKSFVVGQQLAIEIIRDEDGDYIIIGVRTKEHAHD
ncbi:MAG: efflux RND transporter periplasmic adaptor subunit, partial [Psychrobium sp.]